MMGYAMKTSCIPVGTLDNINKLDSNFIWTSDSERRGLSLVAKDKSCMPQVMGGLEILNSRLWN